MVNLRLHGKEEELKSLIEKLKSLEDLEILDYSAPYRDRGESKYSRVYLDIELEK